MRSSIQRWVLPGVLMLLIGTGGEAGEQDQATDLARLSTTGTLRGSNQNEAGENMRDLAEQLQALYDMGGSAEAPDEDTREEIEERSEDLADAAGSLLGFINQIRGNPEDETASIPEESFDRRTRRLVDTYLGVVDPLREFVSGESLDGEELDRLRSALMTIEALSLALPSTEF